MTSSKWWGLLLLALFSGCSFQSSPENKTADGSNFDLASFSVVTQETAYDAAWEFPNRRVYHVKAKVVDRATLRPRVGETFNFVDHKSTVTSDVEGWIYWTEAFDFRYLAPENFLKVQRRLYSGAGGTYTLEFAIDPWKEGPTGLVDLRAIQGSLGGLVAETKTKEALRGEGEFAIASSIAPEKSNLQVRNGGIDLLPDGVKVSLNVDYLRRNLEKKITAPVALAAGEFKLSVKLFQNADGKALKPVGSAAPVTVIVQKGGVVQASVPLIYTIDANSERLVEYSLVPTDDKAGILPVTGFAYFERGSARFSGIPWTERPTVGGGLLSGDKRESTLTLIDYRITRKGEGEFDPKTWQVPVEAEVRVCPGDLRTVDRRAVSFPKGTRFEVELSDKDGFSGGKTPKEVEDDGCLAWVQTVTDEYSKNERRLPKYIVVKALDGGAAGQTITREIALVPRATDAQVFYYDTSRLGKARPVTGDEVSSIQVAEFSAKPPQWEFTLDRFLQLTQTRPYSLVFRPKLFRANSLSGGQKSEDLRAGTPLKIRGVWIAQANAHAPAPAADARESYRRGQYLAHFEATTEVGETGLVTVPAQQITHYTDTPFVESRMDFVLFVEPVTAGKSPLTPVFRSPTFDEDKPNHLVAIPKRTPTEIAQELIPKSDQIAISDYEPKAVAGYRRAPWTDLTVAPTEYYLDYKENFGGFGPTERVSLDEKPPAGWTSWDVWRKKHPELGDKGALRGTLASLLPEPAKLRSAVKELCALAKLENPKACESDPQEYFVSNYFVAVDEVRKVRRGEVHFSVESLNAVFTKEKIFNERWMDTRRNGAYWSDAGSGSVSFQVGPLNSGYGVQSEYGDRLERFSIRDVAVTEQIKGSLGHTRTLALRTEDRKIEFEADLRYCLTVGGRNPGDVTHVFCQSRKNVPSEEHWFNVRENRVSTSGATTDPGNFLDRGLWLLMRGSERFKKFDKVITDKTKAFAMGRVDSFVDGVDKLSTKVSDFKDATSYTRMSRDGGFFPGLLTLTEIFPLARWPVDKLQLFVNKCIDGEHRSLTAKGDTKVNLPLVEQMQTYCECQFENAARRWSYEGFVGSAKEKMAELDKIGVTAACNQFATGAKR